MRCGFLLSPNSLALSMDGLRLKEPCPETEREKLLPMLFTLLSPSCLPNPIVGLGGRIREIVITPSVSRQNILTYNCSCSSLFGTPEGLSPFPPRLSVPTVAGLSSSGAFTAMVGPVREE